MAGSQRPGPARWPGSRVVKVALLILSTRMPAHRVRRARLAGTHESVNVPVPAGKFRGIFGSRVYFGRQPAIGCRSPTT